MASPGFEYLYPTGTLFNIFYSQPFILHQKPTGIIIKIFMANLRNFFYYYYYYYYHYYYFKTSVFIYAIKVDGVFGIFLCKPWKRFALFSSPTTACYFTQHSCNLCTQKKKTCPNDSFYDKKSTCCKQSLYCDLILRAVRRV